MATESFQPIINNIIQQGSFLANDFTRRRIAQEASTLLNIPERDAPKLENFIEIWKNYCLGENVAEDEVRQALKALAPYFAHIAAHASLRQHMAERLAETLQISSAGVPVLNLILREWAAYATQH